MKSTKSCMSSFLLEIDRNNCSVYTIPLHKGGKGTDASEKKECKSSTDSTSLQFLSEGNF